MSTIMTRQNEIPGSEPGDVNTALIPLWDMANHTSGWVRVLCIYSHIFVDTVGPRKVNNQLDLIHILAGYV